jgi:diguanylate cyclase (GGDEF)-like protein
MKRFSKEINRTTKFSIAANVALGAAAWVLYRRGNYFRNQAQYDDLTGLFNAAKLKSDIADLHARGKEYSILWGDADNFKKVNDQFGHVKGDYALKGLARAFQRSLRVGDRAYRAGGDEMAALLDETAHEGDHRFNHEQTAKLIGTRVVGNVFQLVDHDAELKEAELGMSIGALRVKPSEMTPDEALHAVDQLM